MSQTDPLHVCSTEPGYQLPVTPSRVLVIHIWYWVSGIIIIIVDCGRRRMPLCPHLLQLVIIDSIIPTLILLISIKVILQRVHQMAAGHHRTLQNHHRMMPKLKT